MNVRILICHECGTVQEIPPFDGPAEYDDALLARVAEHQSDGGKRGHIKDLAVVKKEDWDSPGKRTAILAKVVAAGAPGTGDGLGAKFYEVKANYSEEAMVCWKAHSRTLDCGDYQSKGKRILPDTLAERKAEGLPGRRAAIHLCDFCPVHGVKLQAARKDRGDYDKKSWES